MHLHCHSRSITPPVCSVYLIISHAPSLSPLLHQTSCMLHIPNYIACTFTVTVAPSDLLYAPYTLLYRMHLHCNSCSITPPVCSIYLIISHAPSLSLLLHHSPCMLRITNYIACTFTVTVAPSDLLYAPYT